MFYQHWQFEEEEVEADRDEEEELEVSAAKECCRDRERRRRELLAERNALRQELQNARRELADKDRQVGRGMLVALSNEAGASRA